MARPPPHRGRRSGQRHRLPRPWTRRNLHTQPALQLMARWKRPHGQRAEAAEHVSVLLNLSSV